MIEPYSKLAEVYDSGEWGKFSLKYIAVLNDLKQRLNIDPRTILDISCGTGELVNELCKEYKVTGSDVSPAMIKIAKKKYPSIPFYVSDMAKLRLEERYDLIVSPFDSVNYLTEPDHFLRAFENIHRLLDDTGYLLFDFNSDKLYGDKHKGTFERKSGEVNFKQICEYDKNTRIAKTTFDFGNGVNEVHIQKSYTLSEMSRVLLSVGFTIRYSIDMLGDKEANDDSYKVLIFAEKRL